MTKPDSGNEHPKVSAHGEAGSRVEAEKFRLPRAITIDGPSGSGKSTLARSLAEQYGYDVIETNTFPRRLAAVVEDAGLTPEDTDAVIELLDLLSFDEAYTTDNQLTVLMNGHDLRQPVPRHRYVVPLATLPEVNRLFERVYRPFANLDKVIFVGRTTGQSICPAAGLKLFLEADAATRARRKFAQHRQDETAGDTFEAIFEETLRHDELDSTRSYLPVKPADGAVILKTDTLEINQVLEEISQWLEKPE